MSGKKKLLITGGFGNLGLWLIDYFSKKHELFILTHNKSYNQNKNYSVIYADISNFKDLKNKLLIKFDYCIHLASYNEYFHSNYAQKALEINTLGTRNLIEILKDTNLKQFIYMSTFHIYGGGY